MMLFTSRKGWKLMQKCDLGVKEIYTSVSGLEVESLLDIQIETQGGQFDSQDLG